MPSLATSRLSHAVRSMDLLKKLFDIARQRNRKIVLPEGEDERIIIAAARLASEKIASPILLGSAEELTRLAGQHTSRYPGSRLPTRAAMRDCKAMVRRSRASASSMTPSMATRLASETDLFRQA